MKPSKIVEADHVLPTIGTLSSTVAGDDVGHVGVSFALAGGLTTPLFSMSADDARGLARWLTEMANKVTAQARN